MYGIDKDAKTLIKFDVFTEKNIFDKRQPAHIYVCDICGEQFGNSAYLYMKHMKEIHDINVSKIPEEGEEFPGISSNK